MDKFLLYESYPDIMRSLEGDPWSDYPYEFHLAYHFFEGLIGNEETDNEDGQGQSLSIKFLCEAFKMETTPLKTPGWYDGHINVNRKAFLFVKKSIISYFALLFDSLKLPRYNILSISQIDGSFVRIKFESVPEKYKKQLSKPFPIFGLGPRGNTKKERAAFRKEVVELWQSG